MKIKHFAFLFFLFLGFSGLQSCGSNKEGCPINEDARQAETNRKGELSTKGGRSNLFSPKMRKKVK